MSDCVCVYLVLIMLWTLKIPQTSSSGFKNCLDISSKTIEQNSQEWRALSATTSTHVLLQMTGQGTIDWEKNSLDNSLVLTDDDPELNIHSNTGSESLRNVQLCSSHLHTQSKMQAHTKASIPRRHPWSSSTQNLIYRTCVLRKSQNGKQRWKS